jgi:saccharopine dehydrogenase-like NADP-dependent oxidoreductase
MVIVAVAGGTGAVGQTIVKALVDSGNNRVFILSRTVCERDTFGLHSMLHQLTSQQTKRNDRASEPHHLVIDYQDVNQVQQVLRQNHVEVVVSALLLVDQQALLSQINLIRGAASSGTVTKFIPSEYHLDFHKPVK